MVLFALIFADFCVVCIKKALNFFSIAQLLWSLCIEICRFLTNSISHVIAGAVQDMFMLQNISKCHCTYFSQCHGRKSLPLLCSVLYDFFVFLWHFAHLFLNSYDVTLRATSAFPHPLSRVKQPAGNRVSCD